MVTVRPDGNDFGPVEIVNLQNLVSHLLLVVGFSHPLSSMPLITAAVQQQQEQVTAGKLGAFTPGRVAGNGLDLITGNPESSDLPKFINLRNLGRESVSPSQP